MSKDKIYLALVFLCLLLTATIIVGVFILVRVQQPCCKNDETSQSKSNAKRCDFSAEALSSGFEKFLQEVEDAYYRVLPHQILYKNGVKINEIRTIFKPYNPAPTKLKDVTDTAMKLLQKINRMKINTNALKSREKKALFQVKHYLRFNFETPYEGNYYSGDFLLGPNVFCWQPMCNVANDVRYSLRYFQPQKVQDLLLLQEIMSLFNQSFYQYIDNLRYGVKAGMVRSVEECEAGFNSFSKIFHNVAIKGAQGIFEEDSVKNILSPQFVQMLVNQSEDAKKWKVTHGKSVNETISSYVLEYLGKPINGLFKYLKNEHAKFCVPSNISSGLASLPLSYVYINGNNTGEQTTKELPTGEKLDGKDAYKKLMPYFTTNDMTPDDVHKMGIEMLNKLYPELHQIARDVTNQTNNDTAKEMFIKRLNESDMFFVDEDIPANESDSNAHKECSTEEKAKVHCPKRWAALQRWFDYSQKLMSMLDPETIDMFHFTGKKSTTPNCPVKMRPSFNPSVGTPSYWSSNSNCSKLAFYEIPFFLDRPGPKYSQITMNAHEVRPGHHTQVQGYLEMFQDTCGGIIDRLGSKTFYTAFVEGWGLYSEYPLIALDTDVYKNRPFDRYGVLKWQVWRALRLIVDTGLHYKGFTRAKALEYFADYAWDTSDGAQKEVTRYQSVPGQATAYMIGQLQIMKLRDDTKKKLGKKFNLKDFHFYLLSQGSSPLSYLKESMETYVECALNEGKGEGCFDVLNPGGGNQVTEKGVVDDVLWSRDSPVYHRRVHYL